MKLMDTYAIEKIEIPSIILMENAAIRFKDQIDHYKSYTIICGVGNNGGDGLAICRHLYNSGKSIDLFIIGNLDNATTDFNINLNILKNMKVDFCIIENNKDIEEFKKSLKNNDVLIDSIFGIGLSRDIEGLYKDIILLINENANYIASVDTPSGFNLDTKKPMKISVMADLTVTFHLNKIGLLNNKIYTGDVVVVDISIPKIATDSILNK